MIQPVRRLRRLLVLLPSAGLGGAEVQTASLLRALAAAGVAISLVAEPALLPGLAALLGNAASPYPAPIGWRETEDLATNADRQARAIAPLLPVLQPDVALVPLPWPSHGLGLQATLASAGIPALAVGHLAPLEPEPIPQAFRRALAQAPGSWAAVSRPVAQRLAASFGLEAGRIAVVPNGIDVPPGEPARRAGQRVARRASLGLGADAPLVVFAGRLEEKKGADLLPALAERLRQDAGATLVALGSGPLGERLGQHPAAQPKGPLRLRGQVQDVGDWLLAADAMVLPSRLEGCPLVFLEAARRGCPVVASAAALECFGCEAEAVASIIADPTIVSLSAQTAALLADPSKNVLRNEAIEARLAIHNRDFMLGGYFTLLRSCHCGDG